MKLEIAMDIQELCEYVKGGVYDPITYPLEREKAERVEAYLATYQPNHLDDKTLDH